jgi:hypothetical protein
MHTGLIAMRARAVSVRAGLGVLVLGAACAEGFGLPSGVSAPLMSEGAGSGGASGEGGSGGAASEAGAGMPPLMFMGEACERGASEACLCPDGGMGTRSCRADTASPTGGAFGECSRCTLPEQPAGGAPAAGTGGMSGSGASGSGSSGSPSAGTGGSSEPEPEPDPVGCDPDQCDEPSIGQVCCTDDDECGYRLLLSCNPQR